MRRAQRILVLSGAGLSKASGIPTYRDSGGLWTSGDNLRYSTIDAYRADPASFTKFWDARRAEMGKVSPNPAHFALRELQQKKPGTVLVTQNVDGLLQDAGCDGVLELHGTLKRLRCGVCERPGTGMSGRCVNCGALMRPDVVLFGEMLPEDTLLAAQVAAAQCDVVIVVGTTAEVYPAAELPATAMRHGAKLIVVDTDPPELRRAAHAVLKGPAEELLPALLALVSA